MDNNLKLVGSYKWSPPLISLTLIILYLRGRLVVMSWYWMTQYIHIYLCDVRWIGVILFRIKLSFSGLLKMVNNRWYIDSITINIKIVDNITLHLRTVLYEWGGIENGKCIYPWIIHNFNVFSRQLKIQISAGKCKETSPLLVLHQTLKFTHNHIVDGQVSSKSTITMALFQWLSSAGDVSTITDPQIQMECSWQKQVVIYTTIKRLL